MGAIESVRNVTFWASFFDALSQFSMQLAINKWISEHMHIEHMVLNRVKGSLFSLCHSENGWLINLRRLSVTVKNAN